MRIEPTPIGGAHLVDIEPIEDERGFFARSHCRDTFRTWGLEPEFAQSSVSFNRHRGTLRGMHYQQAPHREVKLVRCTRGAVFDVIVDLRGDSPTFLRSVGVELSAGNHRAVYVPHGVAHGFVSLTDDAEVLYQISVPYVAGHAAGVRWDDPAFAIAWPLSPLIVSGRDRLYPDFLT